MSAGTASLHTLANGVQVVLLDLPQLQTCSASIFVRCGSGHERSRRNGIGHVIEHMAFKGTATRDARQINLDAERLGAEVNAHTDKDHTAFHMRGLADHAPRLLRMLADIVRHATFPEAEFERERSVLLHEFTEDEDDPMSTAFKLFDRAAWGTHALAQPVIGTRANIERFRRADLVDHVAQHYTGANLVVAVAGPLDADTLLREAEAAFGSMPAGQPNRLTAPAWHGGIKQRAMAGSSQTHLVLGFPVPAMQADDPTAALAAALLGEGMSSPLMDQLREQRGLVYYAACSADLIDSGGQFIIEASTSPAQLDEALTALGALLAEQAERITAQDLERARNQIRVRRLRGLERTGRRLEEAALDALLLGRLRDRADWLARMDAVDADAVRRLFAGMAASGAALALTGRVPRGSADRARDRLAAAGLLR
ncbi:M16 family metallopeptidase [Pseudaquabacterium pictum]|uniref:Peptidase M16 n=1 Tax=Pseudaquabacterium pictum TaxID=2315236 RepID=A0A480AZW5_9BURK|nr:pitrilysin family protein [Rubrivivax pictus]GCL64368.1 peptidase M16 [Rubrivivax pictus]